MCPLKEIAVWRISSVENYLKLSVVSYPLASGLDVFVVVLHEVFLPVAVRGPHSGTRLLTT